MTATSRLLTQWKPQLGNCSATFEAPVASLLATPAIDMAGMLQREVQQMRDLLATRQHQADSLHQTLNQKNHEIIGLTAAVTCERRGRTAAEERASNAEARLGACCHLLEQAAAREAALTRVALKQKKLAAQAEREKAAALAQRDAAIADKARFCSQDHVARLLAQRNRDAIALGDQRAALQLELRQKDSDISDLRALVRKMQSSHEAEAAASAVRVRSLEAQLTAAQAAAAAATGAAASAGTGEAQAAVRVEELEEELSAAEACLRIKDRRAAGLEAERAAAWDCVAKQAAEIAALKEQLRAQERQTGGGTDFAADEAYAWPVSALPGGAPPAEPVASVVSDTGSSCAARPAVERSAATGWPRTSSARSASSLGLMASLPLSAHGVSDSEQFDSSREDEGEDEEEPEEPEVLDQIAYAGLLVSKRPLRSRCLLVAGDVLGPRSDVWSGWGLASLGVLA